LPLVALDHGGVAVYVRGNTEGLWPRILYFVLSDTGNGDRKSGRNSERYSDRDIENGRNSDWYSNRDIESGRKSERYSDRDIESGRKSESESESGN
jgi:hypothetical protein